MMKGILNAIQFVGISLEEALKMSSSYPGRLLTGSRKLGKIEKDFSADFVVFDNNLEISRMIIA